MTIYSVIKIPNVCERIFWFFSCKHWIRELNKNKCNFFVHSNEFFNFYHQKLWDCGVAIVSINFISISLIHSQPYQMLKRSQVLLRIQFFFYLLFLEKSHNHSCFCQNFFFSGGQSLEGVVKRNMFVHKDAHVHALQFKL